MRGVEIVQIGQRPAALVGLPIEMVRNFDRSLTLWYVGPVQVGEMHDRDWMHEAFNSPMLVEIDWDAVARALP